MGPSAVAAHATTAFSPVEVHVISPVKLPLHLARRPRELKGVEFCSKECHEILKFWDVLWSKPDTVLVAKIILCNKYLVKQAITY